MTASTNRRPTPDFLASGRTYMPHSRPLCASFAPSRKAKPAIPNNSAPQNAPNIEEERSRSAKRFNGLRLSLSNVLPKASGLFLSPARRISRNRAAAAGVNRRTSISSAFTRHLALKTRATCIKVTWLIYGRCGRIYLQKLANPVRRLESGAGQHHDRRLTRIDRTVAQHPCQRRGGSRSGRL